MQLNRLQDLALHGLQDIYNAEQQALQALQQMEQTASHPELKAAFQEHRAQTQGQVQRLEQIFQTLGKSPEGVTCKGMRGLIAEAQELINEQGGDPDVKDAGLIEAAQKAEHYEIASYGTAATYAKLLGQDEAVNLLLQTLEEEKQTDEKLTNLAKTVVNPDAAQQ